MTNKTVEKHVPGFLEAFNFWLKLGFISFGGPAGQIAIMHEFLVEKKKWISPSRFLHALNYCMVLPGPEAQQLATYIGWLLHGTWGGLTAGILFILPSIFILLLLSIVYVTFGHLTWVTALFYGLKPAVVAIILLALVKIGSRSLLSPVHYGMAALSFLLIFFFNVPFPYIILGAVVIGIMMPLVMSARFRTRDSATEVIDTDEHQYVINRYSHHESGRFNMKYTIAIIVVAVLLWFLPLGALRIASDDFDFWLNLSGFFTKAAFITFGGAYAVLPYVAQVSVEKFNWLSQYEMIDGLALGETTPGPLIMVLAFVGFMAGYNHFGSLAAATTGLLLTTFYTFLPCFLFILAGAPLVERTKENKDLKAILSFITAAVVGVILNLTIYFGRAVVLPDSRSPDWFAIVWLIVSAIALYRFKVNMIVWIGVSALAGFLYLMFTGSA